MINICNFFEFSRKLLADIQLQILLSSSLSWFSRILIDGAPIRRQVSLTNKRGVQSALLGISLLYSKKRSGPRMEP